MRLHNYTGGAEAAPPFTVCPHQMAFKYLVEKKYRLLPPIITSPYPITTRAVEPWCWKSMMRIPLNGGLRTWKMASRGYSWNFMSLTRWCSRRPPMVPLRLPIGDISRIVCYPTTSLFWFSRCHNASFFMLGFLPFMHFTKIMRRRLNSRVVFIFSMRSECWSWCVNIPLANLHKAQKVMSKTDNRNKELRLMKETRFIIKN